MTKLEIIKEVGSIVVSLGVSAIVGNIVRSTTPSSISTYKKVVIGVGGFMLTGMVNNAVKKYTVEYIDDLAKNVKKMVKKGDLD